MFRILSLDLRANGPGFRVQDLGFKGQGLEFRGEGEGGGLRVHGYRLQVTG